MVLGLAKGFVIAIIVGIIFWIGMEDYTAFFWIVGGYIIIKIIWKFLTHGK